jgi:hypothetical protein
MGLKKQGGARLLKNLKIIIFHGIGTPQPFNFAFVLIFIHAPVSAHISLVRARHIAGAFAAFHMDDLLAKKTVESTW